MSDKASEIARTSSSKGTLEQFSLHAILPALQLSSPITCGPVVFCTTDDLDRYSLSGNQVAASLRRLSTQMRDQCGARLNRLGLALIPSSHASQLLKLGLPRMCRDAFALCHITRGSALNCHHRQQTTVAQSDYFDALPIRIDGRDITIRRPGLTGLGWRLHEFRPALPVHLGQYHADFQCDQVLLSAFTRAVDGVLRGRYRRTLRQVFRAVALTIHATRILQESESVIYDLTPRVASWVGAFETLVHPGKGRADFGNVLTLLERVRWQDRQTLGYPRTRPEYPSLNRRMFKLRWRGEKSRIGTRINAPCRLYERLYELRNALAHGNHVQPSDLVAHEGRRSPWITQLAPLLFRECLLERLREIGVQPPGHAVRGFGSLQTSVQYSMDAAGYHEALANGLFGFQRRHK